MNFKSVKLRKRVKKLLNARGRCCGPALALSVAAFFSASLSLAQNEAVDLSTVPLPDGVPELPALEEAPLTISGSNINEFRAVLPLEITPLFRSGNLTVAAQRALKFIWRLDDTWEGLSRQAAQTNERLIDQGTLLPELKLEPSFAFGSSFDLIPRESEAAAGAKIAWNTQSALWGQRAIEAPFDLFWYKDGRVQRLIRGILLRAYPQLLGNSTVASNRQLFREKLVLRSPEALSGLTMLTFRFLGTTEDVTWMYSPAIKKARQLTGSNRSDALFRSSLSLDDFFVWSGKPELVDAKLDSTKIVLGAFASPELAPLTILENGCATVGPAGSEAGIKSGLSNVATVFLSSSIFVPRRTWRVELTGRDPYSLYGRQVIYVDHDSMLPLYKFVYDRSGHLWKSIVGVYGLAATHDRKVRRTFQSLMYIYNHRDNTVQVVRMPSYTTCSTESEMLKAAQFDPNRLWPKDGGKVANAPADKLVTPPPAVEKKTPVPEEILDLED